MTTTARILAASAALLASTSTLAAPPSLEPKPASAATAAAQREAAARLPMEDGRDADFAARGFLATRADPVIRNAAGKQVWNLAAFDFMAGASPDSVNPSLWRLMRHLKRHGQHHDHTDQ